MPKLATLTHVSRIWRNIMVNLTGFISNIVQVLILDYIFVKRRLCEKHCCILQEETLRAGFSIALHGHDNLFE